MTVTANDLLKATARSFYLTLRVLPAPVRPQIGLAYLLARTTDTVADTEIVPPAQRLDARQQGSPAEKLLLEQAGHSLAALQALSTADRELVRTVLLTITAGQELDV